MKKRVSVCLIAGAFALVLSACTQSEIKKEEQTSTVSEPVETVYEIEAVIVESEKSDEETAPEQYSEEDLVSLAGFYYRMQHPNQKLIFSIAVESITEDIATIHLFADHEDHVETLEWYDINIKTLQGEDTVFGEPVDFSDAVFFLQYQKEHDDEAIPCIYSNDTYYVFSAGTIEGSMRVFNGKFYVYDKNQKGYLASENVTDDDSFVVIDQSIYYNKYHLEDSDYGVYRANFALQNEELVVDFADIVAFNKDYQTLFVAKDPEAHNYAAMLEIIDLITGIEKTVFDPSSLKWDMEELDKIEYHITDFDGEIIRAVVEQYGYREGESIGWRDTLVNSKEIEVSISMNAADIFTPITEEEYEKFSKTGKATNTSDFDDFSELMEQDYLGTWYDPESKEAIRLTEKGAYVYNPALNIYGNECYEWELIDRSKDGKCPELAIYFNGREAGPLAYYIAGYRDGYFYGIAQGFVFYKQKE